MTQLKPAGYLSHFVIRDGATVGVVRYAGSVLNTWVAVPMSGPASPGHASRADAVAALP